MRAELPPIDALVPDVPALHIAQIELEPVADAPAHPIA